MKEPKKHNRHIFRQVMETCYPDKDAIPKYDSPEYDRFRHAYSDIKLRITITSQRILDREPSEKELQNLILHFMSAYCHFYYEEHWQDDLVGINYGRFQGILLPKKKNITPSKSTKSKTIIGLLFFLDYFIKESPLTTEHERQALRIIKADLAPEDPMKSLNQFFKLVLTTEDN